MNLSLSRTAITAVYILHFLLMKWNLRKREDIFPMGISASVKDVMV